MAPKAWQEISPETLALSSYMADAPYRPLPDDVVEIAKHHFLDTIAAIVSGSRLPPGVLALRHASVSLGRAEAFIIGSDIITGAAAAAMANGMCAHSDETDDSHYTSRTHPGAAIVPAVLATAQKLGCDGTSVIRALVLGYDVCTRVVHALDMRGFARLNRSCHGFGGTFGAGAAAGALHCFDAERSRFLLSYCAQMASGCGAYMHDSQHVEKAYVYAGKSAECGVSAALMVASGFTGAPDVFSGDRNFLDAYAAHPDRTALVADLGAVFEIMRTNLKKWCVGSPIQAPLDGLEAIVKEQGISISQIESIDVQLAPANAATVDGRPMSNVNLQHLFGLMLADGGLTFDSSHDQARMGDPSVLALSRRVRIIKTAELETARPPRQSIVSLRLTDGREFSRRIVAVRGSADNRMSREEVEAKALDLMAPILGVARAANVARLALAIERPDSLVDLFANLRACGPLDAAT
jgi:2-methylcitrate dehydratase PrpD